MTYSHNILKGTKSTQFRLEKGKMYFLKLVGDRAIPPRTVPIFHSSGKDCKSECVCVGTANKSDMTTAYFAFSPLQTFRLDFYNPQRRRFPYLEESGAQ